MSDIRCGGWHVNQTVAMPCGSSCYFLQISALITVSLVHFPLLLAFVFSSFVCRIEYMFVYKCILSCGGGKKIQKILNRPIKQSRKEKAVL